MYACNSKFMELEALANLNRLRISSNAVIREGMVMVSVLLTDNEGQSINRYSRLETVSSGMSIIQELHQEAFIEAVTDYFSIGTESPMSIEYSEINDTTEGKPSEAVTVPEEPTKASEENDDDFPVLFGKYKGMKDGNMFSQLVVKDPDTLKKLLRVPHPTAPAMVEYQQKAKAFLEARNIEL